MADDLLGKLFAVAIAHFQEQDASVSDVQGELLLLAASIAAAIIGDDPALATLRRTAFDDLLNIGINKRMSDKTHH